MKTNKTNIAPEFETVETFAQFLMDDDRETFTLGEAQKVAENVRQRLAEVVQELTNGYGFKVSELKSRAVVRGFSSNNHDLYSAKNGWVMGQPIGNASRHMASSAPGFGK